MFLYFLLLVLVSVTSVASDQSGEHEVYVVYMGGKGSSTPGTLRDDQARLLEPFSQRSSDICTHAQTI